MRPITILQTSVGSSPAVPLDTYQNPFNVGIGVDITGTVSYTVQHTFSNVQDPAVTPVWYNHSTLVAQSVDADGNYAFPVTAVRLTINSGTGSAIATFIQAGMPGR